MWHISYTCHIKVKSITIHISSWILISDNPHNLIMLIAYIVGQAFSVLQVSRCVWQVLVPASVSTVHGQGHVIVVRPEKLTTKHKHLNISVWMLITQATPPPSSYRTHPLHLRCCYCVYKELLWPHSDRETNRSIKMPTKGMAVIWNIHVSYNIHKYT